MTTGMETMETIVLMIFFAKKYEFCKVLKEEEKKKKKKKPTQDFRDFSVGREKVNKHFCLFWPYALPGGSETEYYLYVQSSAWRPRSIAAFSAGSPNASHPMGCKTCKKYIFKSGLLLDICVT